MQFLKISQVVKRKNVRVIRALSNSILAYVLRCFTKTNGTFSSNTLPVMPIVAPYQQDSLEMKPLNHVMVAMCLASSIPECSAQLEEDSKEKTEQPSAQHPCCRESMNQLSMEYTDGKSF